MSKQTLEQAIEADAAPNTDHVASHRRSAFRAGAAWGMRHAAWLCRYEHETMAFMRNDAARAQAEQLETSCLATAQRIERGEYENPTTCVDER